MAINSPVVTKVHIIDVSICLEMEPNDSGVRWIVETLGREAFVVKGGMYAVLGATG